MSDCSPKYNLKIGGVTGGRCEGNTAEPPPPSHGPGTTPQTGLTRGLEPPGLPPARPQLPPRAQLKQHWWNQHCPCGKNYACFYYHCFGPPSPSSWIELAGQSSGPAPVLPTLKVEREMGWNLRETAKPTAERRQIGHLLRSRSITWQPAHLCGRRLAPGLKRSWKMLLHCRKHRNGRCSSINKVPKRETGFSMALSSLNQAVLMLGNRLSSKEMAA